ncbi:interferon-inducible double-stranded RNA-dependent protein kinase activator A homolog A-like [Coccinella septempunctata]|uniref:interferon-inducible double-stranded RNA-dependent protein kinase activator A homolog A-like n=1 Tax=Coccinella septempunctata TaxID=41139 RepID=UPI001D066201|nr:interferon-inducible double-stranded RNA-dependent protein kinase activator A homolog A-like [Coccinella septempunctata]
MAFKTPISVLQELMVSRREAFPEYTFESVGNLLNPQFSCTVTVSSVTVVAYARNKKDAKQKAAANALQQLQKLQTKESTVEDDEGPVENPEIFPKESPKNYCDGINYVGQLNEYVTRTKCFLGVRYEDSIEIGSNHFKVTCILGTTKTFGYAMNKKQAKQRAACEMLNYLKSSGDTRHISSDTSQNNSKDELDRIALAKFNELSISRITPVREMKKDVAPSESIMSKEYGLEEAREKLKSLNLSYTSKKLQEVPYIVVVQIDDKPITAVGVGDNEHNATVCAMNKALHALSVGCSFT